MNEGLKGYVEHKNNKLDQFIAQNGIVDPRAGQVPIEIAKKGIRFNQGKIRYDLIHPIGKRGLAMVLTKGAEKYAQRNWEKGLSWMEVTASLERHLEDFKAGIDYDKETGLLHVDHIQCNAHFLSTYYKIAPQFDDRPKIKAKKIGLDIDEVICDWVGPWIERFGYGDNRPEDWNFSYVNKEHFDTLKGEDLENYYLNLPPRIKPSEIPFQFDCYITARSVDVELTKRWLLKNGFPANPVYSMSWGTSKLEKCKELELDYFIDDNYKTYLELNEAGITCFLMDAPHNKRFDVGYRRVTSLADFYERFLKY